MKVVVFKRYISQYCIDDVQNSNRIARIKVSRALP
jgi:hypothetical protein